MAPEVLSKGTAYDSSADWFSFGCMLYKLLKGHSPFRQHKTKDKHEIDRMTLTMNVELPDTFSLALRQLLEGLLQVRNNLQIVMYTEAYIKRDILVYQNLFFKLIGCTIRLAPLLIVIRIYANLKRCIRPKYALKGSCLKVISNTKW